MTQWLCAQCGKRPPVYFQDVTFWRGQKGTTRSVEVCRHCLEVFEALLEGCTWRITHQRRRYADIVPQLELA